MAAVDISSESKIPEDDPKRSGFRTQVVVRFVMILLVAGGAGWWALSSADDAKRPTSPAAALAKATPGETAPEEPLENLGSNQIPSALIANFHVNVRVTPAHAKIYLDGIEVGHGRLQLELPRDGHVHEIRILADGYAPERLVFADASPQREVVLAQEDEDGERIESPTARRPTRATPPAPHAGIRREAAPVVREHKEEVRKEAVGSSLPSDVPKPAPTVRIIEGEGPNVRVVE